MNVLTLADSPVAGTLWNSLRELRADDPPHEQFDLHLALAETQILATYHSVRRGRVAVLFEFRTGLWIARGNVVLLVLEGVSEYEWDGILTNPSVAWTVLAAELAATNGQTVLTLPVTPWGQLKVTFNVARYAVGVARELRDDLSDYSEPEEQLAKNLPSWTSELSDVRASAGFGYLPA